MANARSPAFMQIFKDLGKNERKKLSDNVPLLKEVTKRICDVAGQASLVGICVQALGMIIQTAENDDKAKKVIKYAKCLKESLEKIADAGGYDEYLKENCLALLCAEAFKFDNEKSRKQSWAKRLSGFIMAKGLDDLANRLSEIHLAIANEVLNRQRGKDNANEALNVQPVKAIASDAPLRDVTIEFKPPEELLTFIRKSGIRILAVCGMGGIGKTSLLTTLYDLEFSKGPKQVKAFVEVRRSPTNIKEIQSEILKQLENKNETFKIPQQGQNALRNCLQHLKEKGFSLCLCIDNVWEVKDLIDLLPRDVYQQLPESSCIMLSTRSHKVAKAFHDICCPPSASPNAYKLFEPNLLEIHEAEQLFIEFAEIQDKDKEKDLLKEIVPLCGGLLLAIKTYGTYFRRLESREQNEWRKVKECIEKANEDEDDMVLQTLEPSIDAQIDVVQDAFIDAALFWRGQPLHMARCALYDGNKDVLEVLLEETLFSSKNDYLECHYLFLAIAQKRAKTKGWKYVTISTMLVSQEEEEEEEDVEEEILMSHHLAASLRTEEVIRALQSRQNLQENLSVNYIIYGDVLTSGTCNISQGETHDLKSLNLHHLLQDFPSRQLINVGCLQTSLLKKRQEEEIQVLFLNTWR